MYLSSLNEKCTAECGHTHQKALDPELNLSRLAADTSTPENLLSRNLAPLGGRFGVPESLKESDEKGGGSHTDPRHPDNPRTQNRSIFYRDSSKP
jgi:hypothetical protein